MSYFSIAELTASVEARKHNIDNTPPLGVKVKLQSLINDLLDPIRERWGKPITVNSGYRCPVLNTKVGGAKTSQHVRGEAADITTGNPVDNKKLFEMIKGGGLKYDQLIWEKGSSSGPAWIHVSYSAAKNRGQILKIV